MRPGLLLALLALSAIGASSPREAAPAPLRVYVLDCGTLRVADPSRFQLKKEELGVLDLSVGCYLISHPRGTLIWDVGAVPDDAWTPSGDSVTYRVVLPDSQTRDVTVRKRLRDQLATIGISPAAVTYIALSHYHYDHTANANAFAKATWLVRKLERDTMFAKVPPGVTQPSTYSALRTAKTTIVDVDDYDVFGDGTVIIKSAPGHTPGHQMLYVKLAQTGPILISGDLYHYPEERTLDRLPTFEYSPEQTRASRVAIEAFLRRTGTTLWIQHDFRANALLRKAPEYYQ
jgi:N-acyl homoserine lactone hydrolase